MKINPLLACDLYKVSHHLMYPEGTNLVYSNFTPRNLKYANPYTKKRGSIVFFGLQGFIKWFLIDCFNDEFFSKPKKEVLKKYQRRMDGIFGKGIITTEHISMLHDIGYLPIHIKALPEGSLVPAKIPVLTITNTHPDFAWLTNYLESVLSSEIWKQSVTATTAYEFRQMFIRYAEETGAYKEVIPFQSHDFSYRGMSGSHDAAANGAAWLTSGYGSDSTLAADYLESYYGADCEKELVMCSVPASEHSVATFGGREGEYEILERLVKKFPVGILSLVADSFDFWKCVTVYAEQLKPLIMSRQADASGAAKVVFRPDSSPTTPADVICGKRIHTLSAVDVETLDDVGMEIGDIMETCIASETPHGECGKSDFNELVEWNDIIYRVTGFIEWNRYDKQYYYTDGFNIKSIEPAVMTPEEKGAISCLWDVFGGTINEKGFKTLDSHVGLIYGEAISLQHLDEILGRLKDKGFASDNLVVGIGSMSIQWQTRDTFGFAMKCTYGEVNGVGRDIFKDPITDGSNGMKKSAKGLLRVEHEDGKFVLYDQQTKQQEEQGCLYTVFKDGKLFNQSTLNDIRARLW